MGGNALSYTSVRLSKVNYDATASKCVAALQALYPQGRFEPVVSYGTKADHGDLDLLVTTPGYDPHAAAAALGAVEVVRNGPVTSIGLVVDPLKEALEGNLFQVDLVSIDAESFAYAAGYFSFNDLGNLIGRTAHSAGLAHRHDGLWYYYRDGDYKFREILLTKDYDRALSFLGYDPVRFRQGFDTLNDIFQYVAGSAFFNRDIFLLENRNAKSRIRDRKRKTYMEFLQFCEERQDLPAYKYPENKDEWLPRVAEHFPHFQAEFDQAVADLAKLRQVKAKFSGEWVAELTGLQGKELGALMKRFKESYPSPEAQHDAVLSLSQEELTAKVLALKAELEQESAS